MFLLDHQKLQTTLCSIPGYLPTVSPKELCPSENLTTRWMARMNFPFLYDAVSIQELIFCGYLCSSPSLPFSGLNMSFTCSVSSAGVACPGQENLKPSAGKVLGEDILPGAPPAILWLWGMILLIIHWGYQSGKMERSQGSFRYSIPRHLFSLFRLLINVICACSVAQLCSTLCDPLDCRPPGSSVHVDSPGTNTRVGCHALLQGIFLTQGSNPNLLHCRWILHNRATREVRMIFTNTNKNYPVV